MCVCAHRAVFSWVVWMDENKTYREISECFVLLLCNVAIIPQLILVIKLEHCISIWEKKKSHCLKNNAEAGI